MNSESINESKIFKYTKTSYSARYYSVFLWIIGCYIVYPTWDKGLSYLPSFIYGAFFKNWTVSLAFLLPPLLWQTWSIFATRNNVKLLKIESDFLLINFFGILKEKSLQLNYSEISSIEWSQDGFKHFLFTLKTGEKKLIKTEIINRERAFELISKKISPIQKQKS